MLRPYQAIATNVLNVKGLNTYKISFWCSTDNLEQILETGELAFRVNGCRPSEVKYHKPASREGENLHIYHATVTCMGFPHTISSC